MIRHLNRVSKVWPRSLNLGDWSIKFQLQGLLFLFALGAIATSSSISWYLGHATLRERVSEQLISIRSSRVNQVEEYLDTLFNQLSVLAASGNTIEAMVDLNRGFRHLERAPLQQAWNESLAAFYDEEFTVLLPETLPESEREAGLYLPQNRATQYLQYYFMAENPNPVGEQEKLIDPGDGSEYTQAHSQYQDSFRQVIDNFGYTDLYLINHRTGDIVYSVAKTADFGTNLFQGPYAQSHLATVVKGVLANPTAQTISVQDFAFYRPVYDAPVMFLATPLYSGVNMIGILAVQVSSEAIDRIMSNNGQWANSGLGQTGEVYLVGPDFLMRSQSRFWQADPNAYQETVSRQGVGKQVLALMDSLDTTVSLQPVNNLTTQLALGGDTGLTVGNNYRGKRVLSAYAPVVWAGANWAMVVEMEIAQIYRPVVVLQKLLLIAAVIFLLIGAVLATLASRLILRPLTQLSESTDRIVAGHGNPQDPRPIPLDFRPLSTRIYVMGDRLQRLQVDLAASQEKNSNLLLNFLPAPIAYRLQQGEEVATENTIEHNEQVTVLYARLLGIDKLSEQLEAKRLASLITAAFDEFNQLAQELALEAILTTSGRYLAVCGLNQPRLDHVERTAKFGLAISKSFEKSELVSFGSVGLQIGIDSGPVISGIIGTRPFNYDVWGKTVSIATQLALHGHFNDILVTPTVHERLGNTYTFLPNPPVQIDGEEITGWTLFTGSTLPITQVELVQASFAKIEPISAQVGELFYQRLFDLDPSLQNLFKGDRVEQQRNLMNTLAVAVDGLRQPATIIPTVQELGRKYVDYGVEDFHYTVVGEALLWTLEEGLGKDFTLQVGRAWKDAFTYLSDIMKGAATQARQARGLNLLEQSVERQSSQPVVAISKS